MKVKVFFDTVFRRTSVSDAARPGSGAAVLSGEGSRKLSRSPYAGGYGETRDGFCGLTERINRMGRCLF